MHSIIDSSEDFRISVQFLEDPSPDIKSAEQVEGGVCIEVDGYELTQYRNQDALEDDFDKDLRYKGTWPIRVVRNIVRPIRAFVSGEIDPSEDTELSSLIYESGIFLVFSWLEEDVTRIACISPHIGAEVDPGMPLRSSLGFPVSNDVLADAGAAAGQEVLEYVKRTEIPESDYQELQNDIEYLRAY